MKQLTFLAFILTLLAVPTFEYAGTLTIAAQNSTLTARTTYSVNYLTANPLPSNANFSLDFSSTAINIPNGTMNVSAVIQVNNNNVSAVLATASCSNKKCTLKLNQAAQTNSFIVFQVSTITNPYFLGNQPVGVVITFNSTYNENSTFIVSSTTYQEQTVTLNSMNQSNYGVGNSNISYLMNLSAPYASSTISINIKIPPELRIGSLSASLSIYGSPWIPMTIYVNYNLAFAITSNSLNTSNSLLLVQINGLTNPTSIGNSSSFSIQIVQNNGGSQCSTGCLIASINNNLPAQSLTAGNVIINRVNPSNTAISAANTITVQFTFYAPIPQGSKISIVLPSGAQPANPISCIPIIGLISNTNNNVCSYNSSSNSIQSTDFYWTDLNVQQTSYLNLSIINAADSRQSSYMIQIFDPTGRMIGNTSLPASFSANPLVLTSNMSKNSTSVLAPFQLTVNFTIQVPLTNLNNYIVIVLPPANYNTSVISCYSNNINLQCSSGIDGVSRKLTLTMRPPCSACSSGLAISILVDNLINPSYISPESQSISISSATSLGSIESNINSVTLNPVILPITNYSRSGSNTVGSYYSLSFGLTISTYVISNGGLLQLVFNSGDAYIDPIVTGSSYNYPSSAQVLDNQNNPYSNYIIYNTDTPSSIQSIVIQICNGSSNNCPSSLSVNLLRRSFSSMSALWQIFRLNASDGSNIAVTTMNIMQYIAIKSSQSFGLTVGNSVVSQNGTYFMNFTSKKIPISSPMTIPLTSSHQILGGCSIQNNATLYSYSMLCTKINTSAIAVTFTDDVTFMMLENILFSLTITNVQNPPSLILLTYTFSTTFNQAISQEYSLQYAIINPYTFTTSYSKTNNTYAQPSLLTFAIASGYYPFDQIKINIPTTLMTVSSSNSGSSAYQSASVNNANLITGVYSLSVSSGINVNVINPSSTNISGNVSLQMWVGGNLAGQSSLMINRVDPVYLGLSASTSNSIVGASCDLTLNVNRVNSYPNQAYLYLNISSSLFNTANAQYDNSPIAFPIQLTISNAPIIVKALKNLKYIPNSFNLPNALSMWTTDASGNTIARTISFDVSNILANTATQGNTYSFTRSVTDLNTLGNISILYSPQYPQMISFMVISLPANQSAFSAGAPSCQLQLTASSTFTNCNIITSNNTAMTIAYVNQSMTIVGNVKNIEPNGNLMEVDMLTSNFEMVENSSKTVTPALQYNILSVIASASSLNVGTNTVLLFNISAFTSIDINSKIVISLPSLFYTRNAMLQNAACSYVILGNTYSNCQYAVSGGWVTQVNLTYLGPTAIPAGNMISASIGLTNSWTSYPFNSNAFVLYVSNSNDFLVAKGSFKLSNLSPSYSNLQTNPITNFTTNQSSSAANTQNTLAFSFVVSSALAQNSSLSLSLPKSTYTLGNQIMSNLVISSSSSTNSTNLINLIVPCDLSLPAPLCKVPNSTISFNIMVKNNQYVQLVRDTPLISLTYDGYAVTTQYNINIPIYQPQTISSVSLTRNNYNANQNANAILSYPIITIPSSNTNPYLLTIYNKNALLPILNNITNADFNSNTLSFATSATTINITLNNLNNNLNNNNKITISGVNNFLVPLSPEEYSLQISDLNYIYYYNPTIQPTTSLIAYSSGVILQRINSTVSQQTNIYLVGNLPGWSFTNMNASYNNVNYAVPSSTFNISLGSIINNASANDNTLQPVVIKNNNFIAYSNSIPITPTLTPQNLTSFLALTLPASMTINSPCSLKLQLNPTPISYLSIISVAFYKKVTQCCVDAACSQSKILNCTSSALSNGSMLLEVYLSSNINLSDFTANLITVESQVFFTNTTLTISTSLPSASTQISNQSISIYGNPITSALTITNYHVNSLSNYTLVITPISNPPPNLPTSSVRITLPQYIYQQITQNTNTVQSLINSKPVSVNVNSDSTMIVPLSVSSNTISQKNITIQFLNIANPNNNKPYLLTVEQASQFSTSSTYGYKAFSIVMNVFDTISIYSVVRSITKVNSPCNLTLQISSPLYSDLMNITMPTSQVTFISNTCNITANAIPLPCQVDALTNSIITKNVPGNVTYNLVGMKNQLTFNNTAINDPVLATIGLIYLKATTLSSTVSPITPRITLGSIQLVQFTSTNNMRMQLSSLTYSLTSQNYKIMNGVIFDFGLWMYFILPSTMCRVNNNAASCMSLGNGSLLINIAAPTSQLNITISNIYNFIDASALTIRTVSSSSSSSSSSSLSSSSIAYSDIDLYYSNNVKSMESFVSSPLLSREIVPNNYIQTNPVQILTIIDSTYPSALPLSSLRFNITIPQLNCSLTNIAFGINLTNSCVFKVSLLASIKVFLYHSSYPEIILAWNSNPLLIYDVPSNQCTNQMCDLCSNANSQQYCFSCREGQYSSNGQCYSTCPTATTPYSNTQTCQPCDPNCNSCFGLYSNNCLTCKDTALNLQSGTCQSNCTTGFLSDGNCIDNFECSSALGCRICSTTGFCYQCLPGFNGEPTCEYASSMPSVLMSYIIIPFVLVGLIPILISLFKMIGAQSILSQSIFSFSFIQLFAWILSVPILMNQTISMVMLSFIIIRLIISIVAYQIYYKLNLGDLSEKLLKEESQKDIPSKSSQHPDQPHDNHAGQLNTCKTKIVRLFAHLNGPDSYELLESKIAEPVLKVEHNLAINIIFMINRGLVLILMAYAMSQGTVGDSIIMPGITMGSGLLICLMKLLKVDKVRACFNRCRMSS